MFCDVFSSHKTNSDGGVKPNNVNRFGIKITPERKSLEVAKTSVDSNSSSGEKYLTQEVWERLHSCDFYKKDYNIFRKLKVGPFQSEIYDMYPPPKTKIARR
jgi:hypothetical protein